MEYTVVFEEGLVRLKAEVNRLIKEGYEPQGGISLSGEGYLRYYTQAMIKKAIT